MKSYKAILVDTTTGTLKDIVLSDPLYPQLAPTIGCDCFTIVSVEMCGKPVSIFVDDEGLLKGPTGFFKVDGYLDPLAGNGLILGGSDEEGDTLECELTAEEVSKELKYMTLYEVRAYLNSPEYTEALKEYHF